MSILPLTCVTKNSNLFLTQFISRWVKINLFKLSLRYVALVIFLAVRSSLKPYLSEQKILTVFSQLFTPVLIRSKNSRQVFINPLQSCLCDQKISTVLIMSYNPTYWKSEEFYINFFHSYLSNQKLSTVFNNFLQPYLFGKKMLTVF